MKQLYLILSLLLSLPLVAMAQDEDTNVYPTQVETTCQPKAYIHFTFENGSIYSDEECSTEYTNRAFREASTISYTEQGETTATDFTTFFVGLEDGKVTYFVNDAIYLSSNASITVTTPDFYVKSTTVSSVTKYSSKSYTLTVEPSLKISKSCKTSELQLNKDMTVIVSANCVLTVDNDFSIPNLIVEAGDPSTFGGGVVIESNGSLTVADTAYFLCYTGDQYFHRNNGYLINRGTYTANASIFTKYVYNYRDLLSAVTYKGASTTTLKIPYYNSPAISFPVISPNKVFGFARRTNNFFKVGLPYISRYHEGASNNYYLSNSPYLEYTYRDLYQHIINRDMKYGVVFRANGVINDEESYSLKVVETSTTPLSKETLAQIDNRYQACIDWSALIADEDNNHGLADQLRCVNFSYGRDHNSYDYNFATGLTTYDGPMQFGYLQPATEPARFYQLDLNQKDNITVHLDKKYLTSYAEMAKVEPQVKVPYVRFYVDDVDCPKGVGNRSIFVAYFLPAEEYAQLASSTDDYDYNDYYFLDARKEVWSPNELPETSDVYGSGYIFPFVGSFLDEGANARIRAFVLPSAGESNSCQGITLYLDEKQTKAKYGILDYGNMDNIQLECLDLLLNAQDGRANVLEAEFDETTNATKNEFKVCVTPSEGATDETTYMYNDVHAKQVGMRTYIKLTNYNKNATSDTKPVVNDLKVVSVAGGIIVSTTEPSAVNIVNLSGILVNSANVEGSTFVALPAGLYIVKADNGKASKVIVK